MHRIIQIGAFRFGVGLSEFKKGAFPPGDGDAPDFLVYSFNAFPEIDFENEITGSSGHIENLTVLSEAFGGAVFCGVRTTLLGTKHLGAAVASGGRLIDIVDRTSNLFGDEFETGNELKIFKSAAGKIGLFLDADCLLEKNWSKTAPLSDLVLCINRGTSETARGEVRLFSTVYEIPYLYVDEESVEWRT